MLLFLFELDVVGNQRLSYGPGYVFPVYFEVKFQEKPENICFSLQLPILPHNFGMIAYCKMIIVVCSSREMPRRITKFEGREL
jgi:hypothetical protein